MKRKSWQTFVALPSSTKQRPPWTTMLDNSFQKTCLQEPAYQKSSAPKKEESIFCIFTSCSTKYFFKGKIEPLGDTLIKIQYLCYKEEKWHKTEDSDQQQIQEEGELQELRIKECANCSIVNFKTPIAEQISGNITQSLKESV